ncbi:Type II secretion system (T2SS), protein F [uncultured archaeon]|nr:Type II secretion system (T2SS), protein F [uncultured archaeon]
MFDEVSRLLSALIPRKFIEEKVKPALVYAGSKDDARLWIGIRVFVSLLIGIIGLLTPFSLIPLFNVLTGSSIYFELPIRILLTIGLAAAGFGGVLVVFYLHIAYVIDGRKRMVEGILPDFLFLVGNNMKSGMSPFYAFRSAIRPEFGPLSEEIKIATQKSLGIDSFSDALKSIAKRIDSKVLEDTTKFFAQALRSGGRLAQLIETTAQDIKQTNRLKSELITSTRMYTLFILFVVLIASPMLLAVSVQFLDVLSGIQSKTGSLSGVTDQQLMSQTGMGVGELTITSEFMTNVGYFIILTNSILAGVFMGAIGGGNIRDGLKYAPFLAGIGLVLFVIFLGAIGGLLGGFSI